MACNRVRRLVFLWIDREREPLPRERFERHLEQCPTCRERAIEIERLVLLVRSRCRRAEVPEGLIDRIRLRIEQN